MKCTVYRSANQEFTYIYLKDGLTFDDLPDDLRNIFGEPFVVMPLQLSPDRKLAYENVNTVMKNLDEQGYHLQMPPKEDASGVLDLPSYKA